MVELESELTRVRAEFAKHKRHRFGKKSERMPSPREASGRPSPSKSRQISNAARARNEALRSELKSEEVKHPVDESQKDCPKCGGQNFTHMGEGKVSEVYDYIPGRFVQPR